MLNTVAIMGRLVATPTYRTTQSGVPVTNFSLAVERNYINRETKERDVDFIDVTAWRGLGDWAAQYLTKGQMVAVAGRLEGSSWTDKDGVKRRSLGVTAEDIYFGGPKHGKDSSDTQAPEKGGEYEGTYRDAEYPEDGVGLAGTAPWGEGGE